MKAFIEHLTDEQAKLLESYTSSRKIPQGSILHNFRFSKDLYFIKSGRVEMCRRFHMENQDVTLHLSSLEAPHILGESNFMLSSREDFIVIASTPCEFLELTESSLEKLKKEHPAIALILLEHSGKVMAERLHDVQERIVTRIATKSQSIDLTVQLMSRFIGNATQCSRTMQEKLFDDSYKDAQKKDEESTKFINMGVATAS